jgi:hypothetical protein
VRARGKTLAGLANLAVVFVGAALVYYARMHVAGGFDLLEVVGEVAIGYGLLQLGRLGGRSPGAGVSLWRYPYIRPFWRPELIVLLLVAVGVAVGIRYVYLEYYGPLIQAVNSSPPP